MRLREHLNRVFAGDIRPRVVEHTRHLEHKASRYIAWFPTWEGPARPDYAAAFADLLDHNKETKNG